jgi:hypothetical protein
MILKERDDCDHQGKYPSKVRSDAELFGRGSFHHI